MNRKKNPLPKPAKKTPRHLGVPKAMQDPFAKLMGETNKGRRQDLKRGFIATPLKKGELKYKVPGIPGKNSIKKLADGPKEDLFLTRFSFKGEDLIIVFDSKIIHRDYWRFTDKPIQIQTIGGKLIKIQEEKVYNELIRILRNFHIKYLLEVRKKP